MIARAVFLFLAPWLLLVTLPVSAAPWLDLSNQCLASLSHVEDRIAPLDAVCPALSQALRDDPWAEVLTVPAEELSAWSLEELAGLAAHYHDPPAGPRVTPGALDAALAGLPDRVDGAQPTIWERFRNWLRESLREWLSDGDGLLPDWLPDITVSGTTARWLAYGTAALIVLMAAALVINELRYWRRRRGRRHGAHGLPTDSTDALPGVMPAGRAPAEQLQALFTTVVDRLQGLGLLAPRPSLTHREVAYSAQLPAVQRDAVSMLGGAAERARFGAWAPDPADVTPHLEAGHRLLEDLAETRH